jgi:CheY-like chemotaxis protein
MMGGELTVTSSPGEGSVFRLEIPVGEASAPRRDDSVPEVRVARLKEGQPVPRVLVVEDGEENRLLLVRLLELTGFDVRAAVNGLDEVEKFREYRPDFIWMDIRMPVMDGVEATRRIREMEGGRETAIVAISASGLHEERERFLASDFDEFVRKPYARNFDFGRILDLLEGNAVTGQAKEHTGTSGE